MKKWITVAAGITAIALMAFALPATMKINWGEFAEGERKGQSLNMVGSSGNTAYFLRTESGLFWNTKHFLDEFDLKSLRRTKTTPIEYPEEFKKFDHEKTVYVDGYIYHFLSDFDKSTKTNTLFAFRMDRNGKMSNRVTINEVQEEKKKARAGFDVVVSRDSSRLMVYTNEASAEEKMTFQVYDNQLALLWKKNLQLPYADKNIIIEDIKVDNKGDVFMLAMVDINPGKKKLTREERRTNPQYKYLILHYNHDVDDIREYSLSLKNKFINDITFAFNNSGDLVCAGYFSNKPSSTYGGSFYMLLDRETREVLSSGYKEFPESFIAEFIGERRAAKGKELGSFYFRNLVLDEDGSAVLTSEFYQMIRVCTRSSNGVTTCNYHYYYNDLLVTSYASDGSVKWYKRIPKKQHTVNDGGYASGFHLQAVNNNLHFIYNENPKNINPKNPDKLKYMTKPKKSVLVMASLDDSGKSKKTVLFNNKTEKTVIRPRGIIELDENRMLVGDWEKKSYRFGELVF